MTATPIDSIVFDCDGVLVDITESYDKTIHLTCQYILKNFLGMTTPTPIDADIITAFKATGGFNDEVDLTYACILLQYTAHKIQMDKQDYKPFMIQHAATLGKKGLDNIPHLNTITGVDTTDFELVLGLYNNGKHLNHVYSIFDQIFYGLDLYLQLYRDTLAASTRSIIHNNQGVTLTKLGRYTDAIQHFEKSINMNPEHATLVHGNMVTPLLYLQKHDAAIQHFIKAKTSSKPIPVTGLAYNKGFLLSALLGAPPVIPSATTTTTNLASPNILAAIDTSLKTDPKNDTLLVYKAALLYHQSKDNLTEVLTYIDQAIQINPENPMAYAHKSDILAKHGSLAEATLHINHAISLSPLNSNYRNTKGVILTKLNQDKQALPHFDKAISISPHNVSSYTNKGDALVVLQQYPQALLCYNTAIRIDPTYTPARAKKSALLLELYDIQQQQQQQQQQHDQEPTNKTKDNTTQPDTATATATTTSQNLENYHVYNNRGLLFARQNKNADAIKCFDTAISLNPQNVSAYNNKGVLLDKLGQYQQALDSFEQALKLDTTPPFLYRPPNSDHDNTTNTTNNNNNNNNNATTTNPPPPGMINRDVLIVSESLLNTLKTKFNKKMALVTGRGYKSAKHSLKNLLTADFFDIPNSAFLEDMPRNLAKPNPQALIDAITALESKHCLYVGDSVEDYLMTQPQNPPTSTSNHAPITNHTITFCGIVDPASPNAQEKRRLFESLGVKLILPSIHEIPKILNLV